MPPGCVFSPSPYRAAFLGSAVDTSRYWSLNTSAPALVLNSGCRVDRRCTANQNGSRP
uniref:Uncharacterized protein n=1 Tax=Zea mays TaxID=4577 RepID=C4J4E5_MAIZE|nr:unknown [Zea mays]